MHPAAGLAAILLAAHYVLCSPVSGADDEEFRDKNPSQAADIPPRPDRHNDEEGATPVSRSTFCSRSRTATAAPRLDNCNR
jgi:hypothetical protein